VPTSADAVPVLYLDASALVKLVVTEPETAALRRVVEQREILASCALSRVEVVRAVREHGREAVSTAQALLDEIDLAELDTELLDAAAEIQGSIRSLDAIHVAAATELGDELEALVTYDARMAAAARALGLAVLAPGTTSADRRLDRGTP
jgi:predicted nucleic acid-binding protein